MDAFRWITLSCVVHLDVGVGGGVTPTLRSSSILRPARRIRSSPMSQIVL